MTELKLSFILNRRDNEQLFYWHEHDNYDKCEKTLVVRLCRETPYKCATVAPKSLNTLIIWLYLHVASSAGVSELDFFFIIRFFAQKGASFA